MASAYGLKSLLPKVKGMDDRPDPEQDTDDDRRSNRVALGTAYGLLGGAMFGISSTTSAWAWRSA